MKHQTKLNNKSPIERIILLSFPILFSFTLLSALILLNSRASAEEPLTDTKSATVSVNVPSACTMTSSGEESHTATVMPGVFTGDIGTTTITTKCNNHPGGYAVYAIGYSDSTYGNTNLIHSTDTSTTIPTGTGTSSSNWSMKLAPGTGTESTDIVDTYRDYTNVPSSYTKVVNKNSATSPTTGSTVTTTYGTYITPSQQIGTYTGRVKYIMVNPSTADTPIIYQISYDKNTEDEVTNMPDPNPETSESTTEVATISINVPVRSGYNFKGWCSVETSDENCSGTVYNPDGTGTNLTIPLDSAGTNNFTLHAMWEKAILYMQNVATWGKDLTTGEEVTVVDSRDNKEYKVAKLADNKIWLLDNLAFSDANYTMTSADTNIAAGRTYKFPHASGSWSNSHTDAYINAGYVNTVPTDATSQAGQYKIGVYYNYCAASAGTYCYASGSGTGNASYDICPAGWRMPTGGSSGEYQALYSNSNYNTYDKYRAALHLPLSGNCFNGCAYGQGGYGYFWSSTRADGGNMYRLYLDTSGVGPQNSTYRSNGNSVRCVAQ